MIPYRYEERIFFSLYHHPPMPILSLLCFVLRVFFMSPKFKQKHRVVVVYVVVVTL